MKWKDKMLLLVEDMLYDNEQIRVRAERIIHLLPYQFLQQVSELHQDIQKFKEAIK